MNYKLKIEKLRGELMLIKGLKIEPNFAAVSAHLFCHPEVNVFCQGRDSILSTELEKQTDTPITEVSISL